MGGFWPSSCLSVTLPCYELYTIIRYKLVFTGGAMSKNTSITLGEHFDGFIASQINNGRFATASEVVRAGLRMLEDNEQKIATLRLLLEEGEASGTAEYSYESLMNELDDELG
jgi:antitoxin ParD1/3/4